MGGIDRLCEVMYLKDEVINTSIWPKIVFGGSGNEENYRNRETVS